MCRANTRWFLATLTLAAIGCSSGTTEPDLVAAKTGLPTRTSSVDTSSIAKLAHPQGGNVFVTLTGGPTAGALDVLSKAGLLPIVGHQAIYSDQVSTVLGYAERSTIRQLARLPFVIRIAWGDFGGSVPVVPVIPTTQPTTRIGVPCPGC
jgi:hypothetical protein